jgi:methanogenic corrinoid protein MtbC1
MEDASRQFEDALVGMDRILCRSLLVQAMGAAGGFGGLERVLAPALERIGRRWEAGELALTQVYMGGRICEDLLGELGPPVPAVPGGPRIGVGVLQDHHQLGKRIVLASLRAGGLQALDLGQGLSAEDLAGAALEAGVAVLMVSVLMYPSALHVRQVRDLLGDRPGRPWLVVGGAPFRFNPDLWVEVGADAMGHTGMDAVAIANRLLEAPCAP